MFGGLVYVCLVFLVLFIILGFSNDFSRLVSVRREVVRGRAVNVGGVGLILFEAVAPCIDGVARPCTLGGVVKGVVMFVPLKFLASRLLIREYEGPVVVYMLVVIFVRYVRLVFGVKFFSMSSVFLGLLKYLDKVYVDLFLSGVSGGGKR